MGPYSLVATTPSSSWTDLFVTIERFTNAIYHYKVQTIMDDAGNPGYATMLSDSASVSGPVYSQDETLETQSIEQIKRFRLFDNYPNPFNPVTTLSFFLPEDNYVKIEIYNIYGEISSTEVNGFFKEGYHTIKFDGSNLPSGTYYYLNI
jgi:flagellar hook assembly protein FlgD